jgi:hypothetical protein
LSEKNGSAFPEKAVQTKTPFGVRCSNNMLPLLMKEVARNRSLAQIAFCFNRVNMTLVGTRIIYFSVINSSMTTIGLLHFRMQFFMMMVHGFVQ